MPVRGRKAARALLFFLALSSCAPPSNLVLLDPALPLLDPDGAAAWRSFRFGTGRRKVLECPPSGFEEFLLQAAAGGVPEAVLLSPLLSVEYSVVRRAAPGAWILGSGLPEGERVVSASWDPAPSSLEAGRMAGEFLRDLPPDSLGTAEVVIVSSEADPGSGASGSAFLEGVRSIHPEAPHRPLSLSPRPTAEELETAARDLAGPGARVVFLNAGSAGLKAAEILDARIGSSEGEPGERRILSVLRLPYSVPPGPKVADITIAADPRTLLEALEEAFREVRGTGRGTTRVVPELLERRSGTRR